MGVRQVKVESIRLPCPFQSGVNIDRHKLFNLGPHAAHSAMECGVARADPLLPQPPQILCRDCLQAWQQLLPRPFRYCCGQLVISSLPSVCLFFF